MKHKFAKYFKESFRRSSDELFSFKYFLNFAFVSEISPKLSDIFFAATCMNKLALVPEGWLSVNLADVLKISS